MKFVLPKEGGMPEPETFDIIVDFDDTLVPTAYMYQLASWECGLLVQRALMPHATLAKDILKFADDFDLEHAAHYGFNPRRFQLSWVKAYAESAKKVGLPVQRTVMHEIWKTAARFKHGPFTPFPGAVPTLIKLRKDGHRLHLLTSGDHKLQLKKILESLVSPSFHTINIVPMHKVDDMARIKSEADAAGRRTIMVGDSKRSDIEPAVRLGITAVWVSVGVKWEFAHVTVEHDTFHTIRSIVELPKLLHALPR